MIAGALMGVTVADRETKIDRTDLVSLNTYRSRFITLDGDVDAQGCDHTFRHVDAWLQEHRLDRETWLGWLQQRGG